MRENCGVGCQEEAGARQMARSAILIQRQNESQQPQAFSVRSCSDVVADRFYIAPFSAVEHVILNECRLAVFSAFWNIHRSGVLTALTWQVQHEAAAVSASSVYTCNHAPRHSMQSRIRRLCACLANLAPLLLAE